MEQAVLNDRNQYPTEEVIFSHLGKAKRLWLEFFRILHADHADFTEEWRYYSDGKSWLLKVTRKSKTIFWLSIIKGTFRITFYLPHRAEDAIKASSISNELKENFCKGNPLGKLRALTIVFEDKNDIENAMAAIAVKLSIR
jgi:hypothetical protein